MLNKITKLPENKEKYEVMSYCLMRIANVENALGNIEQAETVAKESLNYAIQAGAKVSQGRALLVLASIYNTKHKTKEALSYIQQAKLLFREVSRDSPDFDAMQGYGWSLLIEANILLNREDLQKSEKLAKEAVDILKGINNAQGIIRAYEVLAKVYERSNRLEEKIKVEGEIKKLKDNKR